MKTIPSKQRKEWKELVTGHQDFRLTNFFLRTKVEQVRNLISQKKIETNNAINELYEIFLELNKTSAIDKDIVTIFGENLTKEETIAIVPTTKNNIEKKTKATQIHTKNRINKEKNKLAVKKQPKKPINTVPIHKEIKKDSSVKSKINNNLSKAINPEDKKELLRQASIERRTKALKKERDLLRRKDKTSLSSIIKSIFN